MNSQGFSESSREMVRKGKVKIDGTQKAQDCSFSIGGARLANFLRSIGKERPLGILAG